MGDAAPSHSLVLLSRRLWETCLLSRATEAFHIRGDIHGLAGARRFDSDINVLSFDVPGAIHPVPDRLECWSDHASWSVLKSARSW